MKLCAIEPKELEEKILIRFAENQNDELLEDLSDYVINSQKEIERLNNIITKAIEAINVYQNEKTLSVGYQDLKRIRGILRGNKFDLQMFEEYLKELGEKNENE